MCFFGHGASGTQGSRQKSYEVELMGLCSASTDALAESAVAAAVCPDGAAGLASPSAWAWVSPLPLVLPSVLLSRCLANASVCCPRDSTLSWASLRGSENCFPRSETESL